MGEEIAFENGRISDVQGLMNLTLDRVILHASVVDLYLYMKFCWNWRNVLWTDGRMDGHLRPALLGLLKEVDLKIKQKPISSEETVQAIVCGGRLGERSETTWGRIFYPFIMQLRLGARTCGMPPWFPFWKWVIAMERWHQRAVTSFRMKKWHGPWMILWLVGIKSESSSGHITCQNQRITRFMWMMAVRSVHIHICVPS